MRKSSVPFLFASIIFLISSSAMALDSSWLLCRGKANLYGNNVNLVLNSYEHRDGVKPDGETNRTNQITFIYGGHNLYGKFDSSESDTADIHLQDTEGKDNFDGNISIDYVKGILILKGNLTLFGDDAPSPLNTKFKCEELN